MLSVQEDRLIVSLQSRNLQPSVDFQLVSAWLPLHWNKLTPLPLQIHLLPVLYSAFPILIHPLPIVIHTLPTSYLAYSSIFWLGSSLACSIPYLSWSNSLHILNPTLPILNPTLPIHPFHIWICPVPTQFIIVPLCRVLTYLILLCFSIALNSFYGFSFKTVQISFSFFIKFLRVISCFSGQLGYALLICLPVTYVCKARCNLVCDVKVIGCRIAVVNWTILWLQNFEDNCW